VGLTSRAGFEPDLIRLAIILSMIINKLFFIQLLNLGIRSLVFEETLVADFQGMPRAEDINNGFDKGLRWRQK
jgi:hypothetical protein